MKEIKEFHMPSFGFFIIPKEKIVEKKTKFQKLELFEHDFYGKVLRLDAYFQTSEFDEFLYHESIRIAEKIKFFVKELVNLIDMKTFGEIQIVHFGEDERVAGFSMIQLIETSLISGHFANQTNNVYLDIFSCKEYNSLLVAEFAKNFFEAGDYNLKVIYRK